MKVGFMGILKKKAPPQERPVPKHVAIILDGAPVKDAVGQLVELGYREAGRKCFAEVVEECHEILIIVIVCSIKTPCNTL